ncbi:hypothetical protein AB0L82_35265 [Nocardia sp. NPDC052001]|uniref:hypothetical protein n=1 Tax=Nocardia sp. NPDC052001 TaxID=3154853 RepID=UPI0034269FD4
MSGVPRWAWLLAAEDHWVVDMLRHYRALRPEPTVTDSIEPVRSRRSAPSTSTEREMR